MDVDGPAEPAANGEAASAARPVDVAASGVGEEGEGTDTLPGVVRGFLDGVWSSPGGGEPMLGRLRSASREAAPRLPGASRNSARDLLEWTRRGSGLRAILVISVSTPTPRVRPPPVRWRRSLIRPVSIGFPALFSKFV